MRVLDAEGLAKHFRGVTAVNGVDLAVAEGELVGLFGPNGAGKTTLFNLIAGAFPPDGGRVRLKGQDITRLPAFRRARLGIGRTFQVVRPFRGLSVLDNVLASVPSAAAAGDDIEAALALLRHVGLDARAHARAGELTLGMLKRLEVARALAVAPCLLLLDEPLAGLTSGEAGELLGFIASLRERTSIVMVEHNVRLALPICDRAVVMDAGSVIAEGVPAEIRANPQVIRAYLGEETE
jgi:ABC-type branched-subunit amino acid transport system ATPase component